MDRRPAIRASDSDRERIAEQLHRAAVEGRLLADELEQRLGAALSARTYGELDRLVSDLPAAPSPPPRPPSLIGGSLAVATLVAVVSLAALARFASFGATAARAGAEGRLLPGLGGHAHLGLASLAAASASLFVGLCAVLALCTVLACLYFRAPKHERP